MPFFPALSAGTFRGEGSPSRPLLPGVPRPTFTHVRAPFLTHEATGSLYVRFLGGTSLLPSSAELTPPTKNPRFPQLSNRSMARPSDRAAAGAEGQPSCNPPAGTRLVLGLLPPATLGVGRDAHHQMKT